MKSRDSVSGHYGPCCSAGEGNGSRLQSFLASVPGKNSTHAIAFSFNAGGKCKLMSPWSVWLVRRRPAISGLPVMLVMFVCVSACQGKGAGSAYSSVAASSASKLAEAWRQRGGADYGRNIVEFLSAFDGEELVDACICVATDPSFPRDKWPSVYSALESRGSPLDHGVWQIWGSLSDCANSTLPEDDSEVLAMLDQMSPLRVTKVIRYLVSVDRIDGYALEVSKVWVNGLQDGRVTRPAAKGGYTLLVSVPALRRIGTRIKEVLVAAGYPM